MERLQLPGKVDVSYNKDDNLIIIQIIDADVVIDIAGYDIGKIDALPKCVEDTLPKDLVFSDLKGS